MAVTPEQLKQISIFSGLEDRELQSIARELRERTFSAGETVTSEGKSGVGFFVIEDGQATVSIAGKNVRTLGPGDHFGEIALITGATRSATIVADTELRCHGLTPWEFRPLVEGNGAVAWKLLEQLAQQLAEARVSAER